MSKPTTVIFDLDGVLINSRELMKYAFESAYRSLVSENSSVPLKEFFCHMGDYFPNILKKIGLPFEMWTMFKEISNKNIDKINLYPNVIDMLTCLKANNIPMAICTGKDLSRTIKILEYFDLATFFSSVVTPEMVPNPKPAPDSIFFALNEMRIPNKNIFYVGDAKNDLLCAKNANVKSILALWGVHEDVDRLQSLANYTANEPMDVVTIVDTKHPIVRPQLEQIPANASNLL